VKIAEILVGEKTYYLGSDIPLLFTDYIEVMITPCKQ
jgi:hypothetical protein